MKESKKKIFRLARTYRGEKSRVYNIKDKNGETLVSPEKKNKRWIEHFDELLNVEVQLEEEGGKREEEEERNVDGEEEEVITEEEFEEALRKMKSGKTPGEDGINIELLREGGEGLKALMLRFLNRCWVESRVPEGWGRSIIVPIYKGKGDAGNCKNYRGISLMDHMAKLYERIIERKLRSKIEPRLGEEQYGYRLS